MLTPFADNLRISPPRRRPPTFRICQREWPRHGALVLLALSAFFGTYSDAATTEPTPGDVSTSATECDPQRFFRCAADEQCIPREWLADGETDCSDGADESDAIYAALERQKPSGGVTPASDGKKSSVSKASSSDDEDNESAACSPNQRGEALQCVAPVNAWLAVLDAHLSGANTANASVPLDSIFRNEDSLSKVEQGCRLLSGYLSCIDGLPASCEQSQSHPDNHISGSGLNDWLAVQMYVCELLVPSVREHYECFSSGCNERVRRHFTEVQLSTTGSSSVCRVVSRVLSDIECVEKSGSPKCDDAAMELFAPLRSETGHVADDLKCSAANADASASVSLGQVERMVNGEEADDNESNDDGDAAGAAAAKKNIVQPVRAEQQQSSLPAPSAVSEPLPPSADIENGTTLSDALYALTHLDAACGAVGDPAADVWAPIRAKICAHRVELARHAKCLEATAAQERSKCPPQTLVKQTTCGAIDAFNRQVDCFVATLSDLCPVEAQDLVVVAMQERLNDEAIAHKCYEKSGSSVGGSADGGRVDDDGFQLVPKYARCNAEQENAALTCLIELVEVNRQLSQFASINFLLELSDANSALVNKICQLYATYERCLDTNVFNATSAAARKKCAFNSPLNTLARIGLSPICARETRKVLADARLCIEAVVNGGDGAMEASRCQSGLHSLGNTVQMMLQGIHGEALLCKSFYLLRNSFECGERLMAKRSVCATTNVLTNMQKIRQEMTQIGFDEGCPANEPKELDAIIARPVSNTDGSSTPAASKPPTAAALPPPPAPPPCEASAQRRFGECVKPLTTFQPHPIAVIKTPRDIDAACAAFETFKKCRADVDCNPLWARGMAAMFEYTCGEGYVQFNKVKQCVRRVTTRNDIRDCVTVFSKSPPQEACRSSNKILACALPHIEDKCGADGSAFVREYVRRFTVTIDPACRLMDAAEAVAAGAIKGSPITATVTSTAVRPITLHNCGAADSQLAERCAEPLTAVQADLERLFQGGFQSFLKNVHGLAPIFERACNHTRHFRECARPLLLEAENRTENASRCVVSSCFMRAGDGVCDQLDVASAIDENLGCVFRQVSEPEFGKCLRSTIATLKQFTLAALRDVLPRFVDCVEPIVVRACGAVPLNVLKVFGSRQLCPVGAEAPPLKSDNAIQAGNADPICTANVQLEYDTCVRPLIDKYEFVPVALVKKSGADGWSFNNSKLCADFRVSSKCVEDHVVCEKPGRTRALRKLIARLCSNEYAFEQRAPCLRNITQSAAGQKCVDANPLPGLSSSTDQICVAVNQSSFCLAESVFNECPSESVTFLYDYTNEYLRSLTVEKNYACELEAPRVALQTGCSEHELIEYLTCESIIDKYRLQPISIIRETSKWDDFCRAKNKYKSCLKSLSCRFEPTMSANVALFAHVCNTLSYAADDEFPAARQCLADVAASPEGVECIEPYRSVDLLGRDAGARLCSALNSILNCSAPLVHATCGGRGNLVEDVYRLHEFWGRSYNDSCRLTRLSADELKTRASSVSSVAPKPTTVGLAVTVTPTSTVSAGRTETEAMNLKTTKKMSEEENVEAITPEVEEEEEPETSPEPLPADEDASSTTPEPEPTDKDASSTTPEPEPTNEDASFTTPEPEPTDKDASSTTPEPEPESTTATESEKSPAELATSTTTVASPEVSPVDMNPKLLRDRTDATTPHGSGAATTMAFGGWSLYAILLAMSTLLLDRARLRL